jgi:predicted component of type VI protein secretion system
MAHLRISSLDPLGRRDWAFPLDRDEVTVGRAADSVLRLADPKVSSRHARISRTPEGWLLTDVGSSNGTWRDGKKITSHLLRDGDTIRLGDSAVRFLAADAPPGAVEAAPAPTSIVPPGPVVDFGPTVRVGSEPKVPVPVEAPLPEPPGPDRTRVLVALAVVLGGGGFLLALLYAIWRVVLN